jgi:hypothetical protein
MRNLFIGAGRGVSSGKKNEERNADHLPLRRQTLIPGSL